MIKHISSYYIVRYKSVDQPEWTQKGMAFMYPIDAAKFARDFINSDKTESKLLKCVVVRQSILKRTETIESLL